MLAFISYAKEDVKEAMRIFNELNKLPYVTPWLDEKNLLPGMDWELEIMKALQECRFILLLLSNQSVSKVGYVQKELKEALNRLDNFPIGKIFAIPVRLDDCEIQDPRLKKLHWVDLYINWNEGIKKIKSSLLREHDKINTDSANLSTQFENLFNPEFEELTYSDHRIKEKLIDGDLSGANFMNQNLEGIDFSQANLSGANFVNANLEKVNFKNSNLKGANFERANLAQANFENANVWGINLWGAYLDRLRNLEKVADINYANFYMTRRLPNEYKKFLTGRNIADLPDYNSFLVFFHNKVGLNLEELNETFKWINHKYFIGMLNNQWSIK